MGKIINMNGQEIKLVSVQEALSYFRGRKGKFITYRSFMQKVYRGDIPFTKSRKGNYWFDEQDLLGYKENTAA